MGVAILPPEREIASVRPAASDPLAMRILTCLFVLLAPLLPLRAQEAPFAWNRATVYFIVTDRFADGDPANNHAYGRGFDGAGAPYAFDPAGHFHGGDLAGLTRKIEEGYFDALGVDALWITAPYEQVHGWVGGGSAGDFQHYAYHGYWPLDFTEVDSSLGTADDLRRFVDAAHARGLRVLFDVVMNHAGYNTVADMAAYDFGTLRSDGWRTWRPSGGESWHSVNDRFIDFAGPAEDWAAWWGPGWVRAPAAGYPACGDDDLRLCVGYLPDFRTESDAEVTIPAFLRAKWGPEKLAREQAALDAFFARTGYPRTPRFHLVKWLTDWVRAYGIDGFRIDTARHVELPAWAALKTEAARALDAWRREHPTRALDGRPFWMVGEVWGHGVERSSYFDHGFDAVLNFGFQDLAGAAPDRLDSLYAAYAARLHGTGDGAPFTVLSYLSSHDTRLYDRDALIDAGTRLLLLPGAVQIFYGDETARPPGPPVSDAQQATRSPMNWDALDPAVLAHWRKLGQFRRRHPAVGAGAHQRLPNSTYAFGRTWRDGRIDDRVIVALGAEGRTTLNVSRLFADDTMLRDAYTGRTAFVSFGMATFEADPSGVLLIEEAK